MTNEPETLAPERTPAAYRRYMVRRSDKSPPVGRSP